MMTHWKAGFKTKALLWIFGFIIAAYIVVPKPQLLERYNFSSVVYDRDGGILHLNLSQDDKYRIFTKLGEIPDDLKQALLLYEDKYFHWHLGFNPVSIVRAAYNMAMGQRVQGASTITMQLARLRFDIDSNTIYGKVEQILRAVQLEMYYSKEEILEAYFNLAPYSGNVEGIGAASLIYFQTKPQDLTQQQSFILATIPQNPNGRRLDSQKGIAQATLAYNRLNSLWGAEYGQKAQTLPIQAEKIIPRHAPHFTRKLLSQSMGQINSTLDLKIQKEIESALGLYMGNNSHKSIKNATVIVVNHKTMEVVGYIGSADFFNPEIDGQVDGLLAYRSPGSALKPFIYALALEKGIIHPYSMLEDIPKNYGFYTPENYDKKFYGIINATSALVKSRNIPAVDLLKKLSDDDFYRLLQSVGVENLKTPEHYGLTLALGGFEVSMLKMVELYGMLANLGEYCPLRFEIGGVDCERRRFISKEASFLTLEMLKTNTIAKEFSSVFIRQAKKPSIYWKTGTSFGYRDAITLGIAGDYVVGVWVGDFANNSGTHFLGREIAAPLFFSVVNRLERFAPIKAIEAPPDLNIAQINICSATGDIANEHCKETRQSYFIPGVSSIRPSYITKQIPIEVVTGKRACFHNPPKTQMRSYNFWAPSVIRAFNRAGAAYEKVPDFAQDCDNIENLDMGAPPVIESPVEDSVYLIRSHQKGENKIVLMASARAEVGNIYWYYDGKLVGKSKPNKAIETNAKGGVATITAIDDLGNASEIRIKVELVD